MKVLDEHYPLYPVPEIASFADILRRGREFHSGRPALADLRDTPLPRLTYGELWREVVRFGRALRRAGLSERDHVAVLSENRVQWAVAWDWHALRKQSTWKWRLRKWAAQGALFPSSLPPPG
jgi:hypothetical protein